MFQSTSVVVVPNMPIIIFPVNGNMWPLQHTGGCRGDWTREEAVPVINKILTQDQLHTLSSNISNSCGKFQHADLGPIKGRSVF